MYVAELWVVVHMLMVGKKKLPLPEPSPQLSLESYFVNRWASQHADSARGVCLVWTNGYIRIDPTIIIDCAEIHVLPGATDRQLTAWQKDPTLQKVKSYMPWPYPNSDLKNVKVLTALAWAVSALCD